MNSLIELEVHVSRLQKWHQSLTSSPRPKITLDCILAAYYFSPSRTKILLKSMSKYVAVNEIDFEFSILNVGLTGHMPNAVLSVLSRHRLEIFGFSNFESLKCLIESVSGEVRRGREDLAVATIMHCFLCANVTMRNMVDSGIFPNKSLFYFRSLMDRARIGIKGRGSWVDHFNHTARPYFLCGCIITDVMIEDNKDVKWIRRLETKWRQKAKKDVDPASRKEKDLIRSLCGALLRAIILKLIEDGI